MTHHCHDYCSDSAQWLTLWLTLYTAYTTGSSSFFFSYLFSYILSSSFFRVLPERRETETREWDWEIREMRSREREKQRSGERERCRERPRDPERERIGDVVSGGPSSGFRWARDLCVQPSRTPKPHDLEPEPVTRQTRGKTWFFKAFSGDFFDGISGFSGGFSD
jgi:hypothetical protein